MSEDGNAVKELRQFLTSSTRADVRKTALNFIASIATSDAEDNVLHADDCAIIELLITLFKESSGDRSLILTIFVNATAHNNDAVPVIGRNSELLQACWKECQAEGPNCLRSSQLLSNLSLRHPERVLLSAQESWPTFVRQTLDLLLSSRKESFIEFLGYVLVNLTMLPKCRKLVVDEGIAKLFPLVSQNDHPARKEIAVDIIRNVSFDHDVHDGLLDADDEFLTAILAPLADEADQLDDEEIAKLPLALQYYDKKRDTNENLRLKIVETLYQLCATRHGRETLRAKGVYALLRELDKASRPDAHKPIVTDHNNALHAVIGVLIRTEAEMEVPSDVHSIRDLATAES